MKQITWTHHHIRRSYHALTFITSVILVAFFAWILGIALASVNAQFAPSENTFQTSPEQTHTKDTVSGTNDTPEETPFPKEPKITVVPGQSIQQRYVLQDGEVQPIFVFKNQFPKFIGQTNIPHSTAILDIFGQNHLTGKSIADSNGNWSWEPPVPLKPGTYNFTVKATQNGSSKALATDALLFEIVLGSDEQPQEAKFSNTPQLGNNGVLFDVRGVVSIDSKVIKVGEEVSVDIKFINFGSPNKAVDVEVQYTITNEQDEIVTQTSETMAVKNELEFSKSFITSSSLAPGKYTLTVAVPSEDLIATSTDTFELISDSPVAATTEGAKKSPLTSKPFIMELLGAMLFLGVIIAYMEYNKVIVLSRNIRQVSEKQMLKLAHR